MFPYELYKILHVIGILAVWTALGALALHGAAGGTKETNPFRKGTAITHGVGMLLILVGGFGMLARLGASAGHGWVGAKLLIWLLVGGMVALPLRKPALAGPIFFALPVLGGLAAAIALYKPF